VYGGAVTLEGRDHVAVISVGNAPTMGEGLPEAIEVHIVGFDGDLYGSVLKVRIARSIRPQKRFDSVVSLARAIRADIRAAEVE
jgi:riboflavin kinase/FMN adenylyltransferase